MPVNMSVLYKLVKNKRLQTFLGRQAGSQGRPLSTAKKNPNELVIFLEWEDLGKAHPFAESKHLRQTMERPGVVAKPKFYLLEEIGQSTV